MNQYPRRILIILTLWLFATPMATVTGIGTAFADPQRNKELQEIRDRYWKEYHDSVTKIRKDVDPRSESEKNYINGLLEELKYLDSQLGEAEQPQKAPQVVVIDVDVGVVPDVGPDGEVSDEVKEAMEKEAERLRKEEEELAKADAAADPTKNPGSTSPGGKDGNNNDSGSDNKDKSKDDKQNPQNPQTPNEEPEQDPEDIVLDDSGNPNPDDNDGSEGPPCIGCLLRNGVKSHVTGSNNQSSKQNHSSGSDPEDNENKPSYGLNSSNRGNIASNSGGINAGKGKIGKVGDPGHADSEGGTCISCGSGIIPDPESNNPGNPHGMPQLLSAKRFLILPRA